MSTDAREFDLLLKALPEGDRREVLDFARRLLKRRRGRTTSFRHVPDPMSPQEAAEFNLIIEEAFEQIDAEE